MVFKYEDFSKNFKDYKILNKNSSSSLTQPGDYYLLFFLKKKSNQKLEKIQFVSIVNLNSLIRIPGL